MKKKELIEFLRHYNKWRRGDEFIEMPRPRDIGVAIDAAIAVVRDTDTDVAEFILRDYEFETTTNKNRKI